MPLDCFSWLAKANLAAFSCSLANLFSYLETFLRVGLMNLPFMSLTEMVSSLIWRSRGMTSLWRKNISASNLYHLSKYSWQIFLRSSTEALSMSALVPQRSAMTRSLSSALHPWLLQLHTFKVELLFRPLYTFPQVLKSGAPLLWSSANVDYRIEMCFALSRLWDVLVDLLNHLIVAQSVLLFQKFLVVREFILVGLELRELVGGVLALGNISHQGGDNHSGCGSALTHLTIEDACSVRSNILQLVDHRVKRHFAGSLFVNDWHPGIAEVIAQLLQLFVHSRKGDQVLVVVKMHRVFNVFAILRVFSIGVPVVPDYPLLLLRDVTILAPLLPSRQFGYVVLTTSDGIIDHEEA